MTKVSTIYYYRENPFTRNFPGGTDNPFVTSCSGTICVAQEKESEGWTVNHESICTNCPLRLLTSSKERL